METTINFETEGKKCLTNCPFYRSGAAGYKKDMLWCKKVGSTGCVDLCQYFKSVDYIDKTVCCSFVDQ